ncbi:hypothetical protein SCP_1700210 [Sparassis crispa]|uniref:Uncharacterized protein n=1 Tax=Sparassis crispa TaxID=139825 RepID=A0A401H5H5_9APHY|nr:hypothetical protein SCP_1700210 [Sparassis crispa]GBE89697.1 hypothetical protein SCP_1700210 [Sparassis crispa]
MKKFINVLPTINRIMLKKPYPKALKKVFLKTDAQLSKGDCTAIASLITREGAQITSLTPPSIDAEEAPISATGGYIENNRVNSYVTSYGRL